MAPVHLGLQGRATLVFIGGWEEGSVVLFPPSCTHNRKFLLHVCYLTTDAEPGTAG